MKFGLHALAIPLLVALAPVTACGQDAVPAVVGVLAEREQLLAAFDAMPRTRLQDLFLRCDRESSERLLDLSEAVPCGMALDALLKRQFAGDFGALLAWWRVHRLEVNAR